MQIVETILLWWLETEDRETKTLFLKLNIHILCSVSLHLMWDSLVRKTTFLPCLHDLILRLHKAILSPADAINVEITGLYWLTIDGRKCRFTRGLWLELRCSVFTSGNTSQWNGINMGSLLYFFSLKSLLFMEREHKISKDNCFYNWFLQNILGTWYKVLYKLKTPQLE